MGQINTGISTKSLTDGKMKITGYANTCDRDRGGDVIPPSAWKTAVENFRKNPVLLFQHKKDQPIGRIDQLTIDAKGLKVEASVSSAAEKLYGVQTLIQDGALKAFSIGFLPKDGYKDKGTTYITELELLEISVVSVPCNADSLFEIRKSMDDEQLSKFYASIEEKEPVEELKLIDESIPLIDESEKGELIVPAPEKIPLVDMLGRVKLYDAGTSFFFGEEVTLIKSEDDHTILCGVSEKFVIDHKATNVFNIDNKDHLIVFEDNILDRNQIRSTFKDLVNVPKVELFAFFEENKDLGTLIDLVTEKTWNDTQYLFANRVNQSIKFLKGFEDNESVRDILLKLYGHKQMENIQMGVQPDENPDTLSTVPAGSAARVSEPEAAKLVQELGETHVKAAGIPEELTAQMKAMSESIAALTAQYEQNTKTIVQNHNSKMVYQDQQAAAKDISKKDMVNAVFLAAALNKRLEFDPKDIFNTRLGRRIEKAIVQPDIIMHTFSESVYEELEQQLVIAPMLRRISVPAKTLTLPVADEDTEGDVAQFASGTYVTGINDSTRVPVTRQNTIKGVELTPHKFMATTHIPKDEQEDSLLPLMDFSRRSMMRRMARAIDKAILRGDGTLSGFTASPENVITPGAGYASVIKGILTLINEVSALRVSSGGASTKADATDIASARAKLGKYGLQLGDDLVFITTIEGYNELVTAADFRTVDKFGPNATYLTGSIGAIYGIPIVITEFLDVAGTLNNILGALIYKPGYIIGERRAIEIESEYSPRTQTTAMYVSTRFDMKALTTNTNAALDGSKYTYGSVVLAN